MNLSVFRHELKYYLPPAEGLILRRLLSATCQPDPHNGRHPNGGYWLRSLYFDTVDNDDLKDKSEGYPIRQKIRLRFYTFEDQHIKLELKGKRDQYMVKETASISREDALLWASGRVQSFLHASNPVLRKIAVLMTRKVYRPVTVVDYCRSAYILPLQNIRITLDSNLRASPITDLFNPHLPTVPIAAPHTLVLEVKFNRFLPQWLSCLLQDRPAIRCAISKYSYARTLNT